MTYQPITVSICGAPLVGKWQILDKLARAVDCRPIAQRNLGKPGVNLVRLHVSRDKLDRSRKATLSSWETPVAEIQLRLTSGAMFYREPAIEGVLMGASIVCYVVASEEGGPNREFQEDYFNSYMDILREKNLTWDDVPWFWILNKVDLGSTNPLKHEIPREQQARIIPTVAIKATGVDLVWKRILNLLEAKSG